MRAVLYNQEATAAMSAGGPIPSPTSSKSQAPISKETSIFKIQNRAVQSAFRKKFTRRGGQSAIVSSKCQAPTSKEIPNLNKEKLAQGSTLSRHSITPLLDLLRRIFSAGTAIPNPEP
jgi:hypothetical protein